mgnify:CR=1 FL=1
MSKTLIIQMRQERAKLIADARALNDKILAEKRDFTQEETNSWDRMMADAETLKGKIDRAERLDALESDLGNPTAPANRPEPGGQRDASDRVEWRSRGLVGLNQADPAWRNQPEWRQTLARATPGYNQGFQIWLRHGVVSEEMRALQVDEDVSGGYLAAPMQFVDMLIKAIDDVVQIRQWANVIAVPNAQSLGAPTLEADPADADWTSEIATGNEDSNMSFGRRSLHPHPLAKRIKLSNRLIRMVPNSEGLARDRLGYKFGITEEKAYLTGSGVNQPLGVFVASSLGISTGRDEATDNTSTAVTFDGITNAKYKLKAQYWPRARWLGHRDFYKQVAKLKGSDGQYIWRESARVGEPDRLLGLPTAISEFAPNTFTTGQYVGILGDWSSGYWIADSLSMQVQRLVELYAEANQTGLIGRLETDGMPVLEEAFVRVKLG